MSNKIEFANIKLHEIVQINKINSSVLPNRKNFIRDIPSNNGSIFAGFKYEERMFSVDISIPTTTKRDFNEVVQNLAYALDVKNPSRLVINDSDIVYYAVVDGSTDITKLYNTGSTTINFICHDPIGYKNIYNSISMDSSKTFRFSDMGTYNSYPVLGFKFSKPSSFIYLVNDKSEVIMVGSENDSTLPSVPENEILINDNCTNSATFTNGGNITVSDNRVVKGNYGVGNYGTSIVATSYGEDVAKKWVGPTFRTNINKNLDQFEVKVNFSFGSNGKNFEPPQQYNVVRVARKSGIYLLNAQSDSATILDIIPYGTDLILREMGLNGFAKVNYNNKTGWINCKYVWRLNIQNSLNSKETTSDGNAGVEYAEDQMGLIEALGFDSEGQILFRFHIRDNNQYFEHVIPEVYIKDKLYLSDTNSLPTPNTINSKDDNGKPLGEIPIASGMFGKWNDFTGTFAIRRKKLENGKYRWWARISRTADGVNISQEVNMGAGIINDSLPTGALNHVVFYIAKYDSVTPVSVMAVNHITVQDISNEDGNNQEEVNVEIFKEGDYLEIDCEKCQVNLNGENFIHKLNIGSQFFNVNKNGKIIVKSDDENIIGSCSYRKRYV